MFKLIGKSFIILSTFLILIGCEIEEVIIQEDSIIEPDTQNTSDILNSIQIRSINFEEVSFPKDVLSAVKYVQRLSGSDNRNKSTNNDLNFTIDIQRSKFLHIPENNYSSYTFNVLREHQVDSLILENIVIEELENEPLKSYFVTYYLNTPFRNGVLDTYDQRSVPLDIDASSLLSNRNTLCTFLEIDTFDVCTGDTEAGGGPLTPSGTSGEASCTTEIVSFIIVAPCNDGGGGGGGSSGGGGVGGSGGGGSSGSSPGVLMTSPVGTVDLEFILDLGYFLGSPTMEYIGDEIGNRLARDFVATNGDNGLAEDKLRNVLDILENQIIPSNLGSLEENQLLIALASNKIGRSIPELGDLYEAFIPSNLDPDNILDFSDYVNIANELTSLNAIAQVTAGNSADISDRVEQISLLAPLKSLIGDSWPQNNAEWEAVAKIMTPLIIELGLAVVPFSDIIPLVEGIAENDYWLAAGALAGLTVDIFGGTIVKVLAKFGRAMYKAFKIVRAVGDFLIEAGNVIQRGFRTFYENGRAVLKNSADDVIAEGDDVVKDVIEHIALELPQAGTRGGVIAETLAQLRNLPGQAFGNGKTINGSWLKGTENNAGFFPKAIADQMKNKNYNNFNEFREDFWKKIADNPNLRQQFADSPANLIEIQNGRAPFAKVSQQIGDFPAGKKIHFTS